MNGINEQKQRPCGHLKNVLMMILMLHGSLLLNDAVYGNNVRIAGEPVVQLNATSDSLLLTFTLSWDHSWRDDFNWDAVWLFVKYKREGSNDAWSHLYLGGSQVGTANLEIDPGNTDNQIVGAFVYPKNKGTFDIAGEQVRLQAPLNGLSASDLTEGKIYFAVTGIEMVLIPYGAYYLGDNFSGGSFEIVEKRMYGVIPESSDIIDNHSNFVMTASHLRGAGYEPSNVADHINYNTYSSGYSWDSSLSSGSSWWKIDFNTPKIVRYFGISGPYNYHDSYPRTIWYLQGSNDDLNWTTLSRIVPSLWRQPYISYPVQQSVKVSKPGYYRYYRVYFPDSFYAKFQNIAMTEDELFTGKSGGEWVETEEPLVTYTNEQEITIPAAYPKGYKGFYAMKYELSQEQYVNFLNMLSYAQQKNRIGNNLDNLQRGDYVFGDPAQPSCRNGIAVFSNKGTSQPVVFGNNLNPAEPFFSEDDGQTLACNYMTGADMLAYLDWSGLRPFSELEYEKMCRTPNRVTAGEYAWNSTVVHSLGGLSGLSSSTVGTENEVPSNLTINVNAGHPSFGPVRCGAFGSSTSTQEQSGSSFYGVMELSGNLGEMYYSVTGGSALNTSSSANEYHGDGMIDNSGNYNVGSYWNRSSDATAFMVRGGSFASADSLLRVSDRSLVKGYDNTNRDSTVTFRGGRSISQSIDPGEIGTDATCPGLITINSIRDAVADCDLSYQWYVKRPEGSDFELLAGEENADLTDFDLMSAGTSANMTYTFRRKVVALTGEAYIDFALSVPNLSWKVTPEAGSIDVCGISAALTASSVINGAAFEWSYHGRILSSFVTYQPLRNDLEGMVGDLFIKCTTSRAGCSDEKLIPVSIASLAVVTSTAVTMENCGTVSFRDSRDGQEYCTVKIGDQCWMGTNLNIGEFRNVSENNLHLQSGIQRHCLYDNIDNCNKYGGLYRWYETVYGERTDGENVVGSYVQGICPDGWHLPLKSEYEVLIAYAGGMSGLKTPDAGWCSGSNCNRTGFNALLSGCWPLRWTEGETTYWAYPDRWRYVMYGGSDDWRQENPELAYSVRCMKN